MKANVELRLLGTSKLFVNGRQVADFRSDKARALLWYLAATQRAQPRAVLAALLWGDAADYQARRSLTTTLSNLRQLLGAHIVSDRLEIEFDRSSAYWADIEVLAAAPLPAHTPKDIQHLATAIECYGGEFLAGFYVTDAPEFEHWVGAERVRYREMAAQILFTVSAHSEQAGEWSPAIDYNRRLLDIEPWREDAHRQRMRLLAADGQRSAALAHYEICRRILADELDVEPDAETVPLYERIRAGQIDTNLEKQADVKSGSAALTAVPLAARARAAIPRHNLPVQTTPLFGRKTEVTDLMRLLAKPDVHLLTILGAGGMGKTRLALAVATEQVEQAHFRHGIYFVALAPLNTPEGLISTIASSIGYSFQAGNRSPRQQLLDYLGNKQCLLLLDNFEHLLNRIESDCVEVVSAILRAAPQVQILVTSRERLKLSAESVYVLSGLPVPEIDTAQNGDRHGNHDAVSLFLEGARRVQPSFVPSKEDWLLIVKICRLVQGMPLGILLASAWANVLSPREIAEEMVHNLEFLQTELVDVPARHRSLHGVIVQTWGRLSITEQDVFLQLSVFRGGFTRHAAQMVTGAELSTLAGLVDRTLLWRNSSGRYEIHELLRQYGEGQLHANGLAHGAREAHGTYYLNFLQRHGADLKNQRQITALHELEQEQENVRAAWQWAVQQTQVDRLAQAVVDLCLFYDRSARFQEGETICEVADPILASSQDQSCAYACLLAWKSDFIRKLGRAEEAGQLFRQSLAMLDRLAVRGVDTRAERAFVLWRMGDLRWYTDSAAAQPLLQESLALCQAIGDHWTAAAVLRELCRTGWALGRYTEAKQYGDESLRLRRLLNDQAGMPASLGTLRLIAQHQGQIAQAAAFAQEQYAISQTIGSQNAIANALYHQGRMEMSGGNYTDALAKFEESRNITIEIGDRHHLNSLNIAQAETKLHLGYYGEALALAQKALETGEKIGVPSHQAEAMLEVGKALLVRGSFLDAVRRLEGSSALYEAIRQFGKRTNVLAPLAFATWGTGQHTLARRHLSHLLQIAIEREDFIASVDALLPAGLFLIDGEDPDLAVELYVLATRYPHIANSRWHDDIAGRAIAAQAKSLSPTEIQRAQARGKSRQVREVLAELQARFAMA